jgi:general stress protein YciG
MQCPNCGFQIPDSEAAAAMGRRGRGQAKARDPKKMARAGRKGGWPKGRKRKPESVV